MAGAVGFLCLTAACLLLARRFAPTSRGWAIWTAGAGIVFLGAFVGIASGAGSRTTIVIFVVAVLIIWTWFTSFALHLLRACPLTEPPHPVRSERHPRRRTSCVTWSC